MKLPFSDITPLDKSIPGVQAIEALILPRLSVLYARRAERLRGLNAQAHGEVGYLEFLAQLVDVQAALLANNPLTAQQAIPVSALLGDGSTKPERPTMAVLQETPYWQAAFKFFVETLSPLLPEESSEKLRDLAQADVSVLAEKAGHLLARNYSAVDAGVSVVLWAALSSCWAQAVALAIGQDSKAGSAESHGANCPCCGAPAAGGLVLTGDREGLRYLQCSLCETRWHKVRATCATCHGTQNIDYWTFEKTESPIQIETCGDCHSYLKIFRQDRDPHLDVLADDLMSQGLDELLEEQGFVRSGINPFSFPA